MPPEQALTTMCRGALRGAIVLVASGVLWLIGCSGQPAPTFPAVGRVVYADGSPLSEGWVQSRPGSGYGARGQVQRDGTFQLSTFSRADGAVEGEHQIIVLPPHSIADHDEARAAESTIAPRFQSFESSSLKIDVTRQADRNRFILTIELAR